MLLNLFVALTNARCSALIVAIAALVLLPISANQALSAETSSARHCPVPDAAMRTVLRDYIDTDKLGVALVVGTVDENGSHVVGYGKLDNGTGQEVDGDTLFEIGSVTKVFTALLLQDMVERAEMKLEDPAQRYLPDSVKMPTYQGKAITLLHLATHTSGLPSAPDNLSPPTWRDPDPQDAYTVEQLYAFLSHYRLPRAPGTIEAYSNLGMQLLGHLIARKAGKSYEELVLERICQPLGMNDTRVTLTPGLRSRLAIGHSMPGAKVPTMDFLLPGAGGLRSSANDLTKFISAYAGLSSTPLSPLMQKAMEFHTVESGGRLMLAWGANNALFGHNGGTYGYKAIIAFDPKKRHGILVLSNCRNSGIVDALTGPLWDALSPQPNRTIPPDLAAYGHYVGQYRLNKEGTCVVRQEGVRFLLQWIGSSGERFSSYEAFPQSEFIFRNDFWGVQATFCPGKDKERAKLILASLGPYSGFKEPLILVKISTNVPPTPTLVHLDSRTYNCYVGQYRKALFFGLFHVGPVLSIFHERDDLGDHLVARVTRVPDYNEGEFIPVSETSFVVNPMDTSEDLRLAFLRNQRGETTGVRVYWNGRKLTGTRISD